MTEAEFQARRRHGIGASDAGIICGYGFIDAETLFRQKLGLEENHQTEQMRLGHLMEPIVSRLYEEKMGVRLVRPEPFIVSPRHEWQFCNPDRLTEDLTRDVQLKIVFGYFDDEWGEPMTDQTKPAYVLQQQHEMGILGLDQSDIAALSMLTGELRIYRLDFDRELYEQLTDIEAAFWDKVRRRDVSSWDLQRAEEIRRQLASVQAGKHKDFGLRAEEVQSIAVAWELAKQTRKEWEEQEEHFKQELLKELGDCGSGLLPDGRILKQSVSEIAETVKTVKAYARHSLRITKGAS
jgi:predicted phage-related endonuclease